MTTAAPPAALQALIAQAMAGQKPQPAAKPLPRLRDDLSISRGADAPDGAATWLVYDPLRHRYIDLDRVAFEIIALWPRHSNAASLAAAARERMGEDCEPAEIEQFAAFLEAHQLTEKPGGDDWQKLAKAAGARPHSLLMTLVHNYLFFRIPLFSPQRFLDATVDIVAPLFRWPAQLAIAVIGLIGLHLAAQQWDEFIHEARGLASLGGIAAFGATLFVVKIFHELGHAYAAVRQGCRVPAMGLAFMMMAPLLYTDVTDAWRLTDRRKRLGIDAAGVAVELGLACLATFAWVFMPDGPARHGAFLIATTSWVTSVAINLNPFMRFDGYYMLADLLGVPNLQGRAFALGRWQMREILFRPRARCPETFGARLHGVLVAYAWSVWVYRLFLFTGIAALVYTYAFKLVGIALFAFEIGYFVVRPIAGELAAWWTMRTSIIPSRRTWITVALLACGLAAAVVPWSTRVAVPAVMQAAGQARVFPPRAAMVREVLVRPGDLVAAGQVIARLEAPDLDSEERAVRVKRETVRLRLDRASADRDDRDDTFVLASERDALESRLYGLARERGELDVIAPVAGRVAEVNAALHRGRWIGAKEPIALVTGATGIRISGYVAEEGLWRIEPGTRGTFVPEMALQPSIPVLVTGIATGAAATIDLAELAATHGGAIEVQADSRQRLVPTSAQYLVVMAGPDGAAAPAAATRGRVLLTGRPESFVASLYRRVLKVLVRESGA